MTAILNGLSLKTSIASSNLADSVATWRTAVSDYDFAVDGGTQKAYTVFTVTGDVWVYACYGICQTALTSGGAATISLGFVTGGGNILIGSTTATDLIADEIWNDATPTEVFATINDTQALSRVVSASNNITMTVGGANLTAGKIKFYCHWAPLSVGASVVPA